MFHTYMSPCLGSQEESIAKCRHRRHAVENNSLLNVEPEALEDEVVPWTKACIISPRSVGGKVKIACLLETWLTSHLAIN